MGAWRSEIVRIAYVKLVPLTDAETAEALAERQRSDTRRLFAHQDAHGPHYLWRLTDAEGIRREIEPYRHTDFARMYWEAGEGDISYYFSKIARWVHVRRGRRLCARGGPAARGELAGVSGPRR